MIFPLHCVLSSRAIRQLAASGDGGRAGHGCIFQRDVDGAGPAGVLFAPQRACDDFFSAHDV
jgi:hypothetical protein